MNNSNEFGRELRALRRRNRNGVTLADLADWMDCSITYVSAIERGTRSPPSNEKIRKVVDKLGESSEVDLMLDLAAKARKSVEFSVAGADPKFTGVLLGLARRSETGGLKGGDPLLDKLVKLLEEEDGIE